MAAIARLTLSAGAGQDNANFGTRVVPRAGIAYALRMAQGAFGTHASTPPYGQASWNRGLIKSFGTDLFSGNPSLSLNRAGRFMRGPNRSSRSILCA